MSTNKEAEIASVRVRVFPSTHRRLKVEAAKRYITLATLMDDLSKLFKHLGNNEKTL